MEWAAEVVDLVRVSPSQNSAIGALSLGVLVLVRDWETEQGTTFPQSLTVASYHYDEQQRLALEPGLPELVAPLGPLRSQPAELERERALELGGADPRG